MGEWRKTRIREEDTGEKGEGANNEKAEEEEGKGKIVSPVSAYHLSDRWPSKYLAYLFLVCLFVYWVAASLQLHLAQAACNTPSLPPQQASSKPAHIHDRTHKILTSFATLSKSDL